ncbi:hypothetical protein Riv7116_4892 [Rivularia sp. PCC 7116]|uniref:hypothetical protein n=1 Tax=Rivularia sp. PCC 7116 TaxID=373994 RepID=UPI00029F1C72|nr:hypothetical protein [Rivularia sp. PCC 7116]AFY57302.1 hypothetical protein Riv7116_4892 [Rivularia sp. PCC 7116]
MSDIFTLNSGDATAIQQHYEQIIETLLRTLLDIKNLGENQQQDLKIFDGDRLVYGRDNNQFRDEISGISGQLLNPQLISELQQLRSTPVGNVVEGVTNKRVELNGQVILHSDENGKVLVNNLLGEQTVNRSQEKPEIFQKNNYIKERQDSNQIHEGDFVNTELNNHSSSVKEDANLPLTNGSTRVKESLKVLEDSPLKNILLAEVEQLRTELKALQQERHFYQELISQRLRQPKNTSWWQQAVNNVSTVVQGVTSAIKLGVREFKDNSVQHKGAASLKTLFHLQTQPGANQYTAGEYQISRQGSLYEVSNEATGKQIMQFRSTPLGVKVSQGNLDSTQIQDISNLQRSLKKNEPLPTTFTPIGKQEAEYFKSVERVTNALVQYAIAQQKEVEIDGVFSYKWRASPEGRVHIEAKDGRGVLLEKDGGKLKSNMSQKDLTYFEQILPKLQPSQQNLVESKSKNNQDFELV